MLLRECSVVYDHFCRIVLILRRASVLCDGLHLIFLSATPGCFEWRWLPGDAAEASITRATPLGFVSRPPLRTFRSPWVLFPIGNTTSSNTSSTYAASTNERRQRQQNEARHPKPSLPHWKCCFAEDPVPAPRRAPSRPSSAMQTRKNGRTCRLRRRAFPTWDA